MGIQINGNTDNISATDGGLTVSDLELNQTGVSTFHSHLHVADQIIHLDDANSKIRFPAADTITAETAGTERLRIDSSGHMGLGVTPSAWPTNNDYKGLQVGSGACIFGRGSGDEDRGGIGVNYYGTTTGAKYITNGHAARIYMADGNIYLQNAASNSSGAGVAMTLDTRLLIDTNGNIGVGDAIPPNFTGYRSLSIHGSTGGALVFGDDGTDEWETYGGDGVFKIYDRAATTTRLHLDGAYGRFGINTSSFSDTATALSLKNGRSDNDHTILDIICNDNQTCRLTFSEDSNSSKGSIRYYYTGDANYMSFYTNGGASSNERLRITSDGYVHLGNTGHGTNAVGGQAITGQDYNPRFKIYNTTASSWLMHLRNDVATNPNGIFMRAGNSSTNYSLYITGGDENKPHIIARGDQKVGIASATPYTTLDVGGSINAGSANQPYQRMFSAGGYQRATKHYFRCIKGTGTGNSRDFDIIQVDLNQNFHQAICKVFYGTRLQNVSDSQTQVNEIIFGINRFVGNNPTRSRQVIHQETNSANHADIDVVITSSSQYRVRLTFSSSCNGSSFAGGYVELIGVGSGGDINLYGGNGTSPGGGDDGDEPAGYVGGASYWGGGAEGAGTNTSDAYSYNAPYDALVYGAGGGPGDDDQNSRGAGTAGGPGVVYVEEYK